MKKILVISLIIIGLICILATPVSAASPRLIASGSGKVTWDNWAGSFKINVNINSQENAFGTFSLRAKNTSSGTQFNLNATITYACNRSSPGELVLQGFEENNPDSTVKVTLITDLDNIPFIVIELPVQNLVYQMSVVQGNVRINQLYNLDPS
jgi:hypothetical protein